MAVYVSNIVIEQGYDFDTSFQLEDTRTNSLMNLTGYGATGEIRKHYGANSSIAFGSSITSPEQGVISISLTSSQTLNLTPGRHVFDVKLQVQGKSYKAVEGAALVRAGVTK